MPLVVLKLEWCLQQKLLEIHFSDKHSYKEWDAENVSDISAGFLFWFSVQPCKQEGGAYHPHCLSPLLPPSSSPSMHHVH